MLVKTVPAIHVEKAGLECFGPSQPELQKEDSERDVRLLQAERSRSSELSPDPLSPCDLQIHDPCKGSMHWDLQAVL